MMIHPSVDKLLRRVDSKYTLVVCAAKRARELMVQKKPVVDKPVTTALEEIDKGIITYQRLRDSIK
ncbi:MAG: DNA-directed RNA polymerase subunit omega [Firmicutes bacterium]|nr:DNA-directed RNA polymerase subunit omega [candidate division NPL-UPA2 bacterium]MBT9153435.1 DNA-directed RNA polymerase subunit omega [candidate division NPL-UPA2 bacterium]MBT9155727.1 DNA-directed RNA polymerase subunit omega [candidate division NPL-UPA2 bacterium]